jgi:hypothetical protein
VRNIFITIVVLGTVIWGVAHEAGARRRVREYATVGIVTKAKGGTFGVRGSQGIAEPLKAGTGVLLGDKIWVERDGVLRMADTTGGEFIISGPATAEFKKHDSITVYRGAFKIKPGDGKTIHFENVYLNGSVTGEAAIWTSDRMAQVTTIAGETKTWHPMLQASVVAVPTGNFTESLATSKQLQPKTPQRVDGDRYVAFLARFEQIATPPVEEMPGRRMLATETVPDRPVERAPTGSYKDSSDSHNVDAASRMKAHYSGHDYDQGIEGAPLAAPGQKVDAYGHAVKTNTTRKPAFEMMKVGDKLTAEQKAMIEKMSGRHLAKEPVKDQKSEKHDNTPSH